MEEFKTKKWSILAFVIFIAVTFIFPVHSAEKKKFTFQTEVKANQSKYSVYLGDKKKHELTQDVSFRTATSTNPDFNNVDVTNYGQSDSVAGTGSHRGYSFFNHKTGDKVYTKWEGTHKTTIKEDKSWETNVEGKIEFIGGTGKFENIKGGGTYTCTHTAIKGGCTSEVETEY